MERKQMFSSITGLKGIFIWLIVLFHTMPDTLFFQSVPGTDLLWRYGGSLGNAMFFILSGFLISWSYRDKIQGGHLSFSDYMGRRLRKLYPPFFAATIAMVLLEVLVLWCDWLVRRRKRNL